MQVFFHDFAPGKLLFAIAERKNMVKLAWNSFVAF